MNRTGLAVIMLLSLIIAPLIYMEDSTMIGVCSAAGPTWAWEDGGYERDGSVTLEGESYDVNPTGTRDLAGKSMRQPPTVLVQASSSGGGTAILFAPPTQGNFGGDSYCASTFGSGYRVANYGELLRYTNIPDSNLDFWDSYPYNTHCNNWTSVSGDSSIIKFTYQSPTNTSTVIFTRTSVGCSSSHLVPCVYRP